MITHLVLWKYRADVPQETRDEHLALLQSLHSVVSGIESFSVGIDILHSPKSYDIGLLALFRDRSVLDAYAVHPDHVQVVDFSNRIAEKMAKVDFEN